MLLLVSLSTAATRQLCLGKGTEAGLRYRQPRTQALPAASCFQSGAISEVIDVSANWELSKQLPCCNRLQVQLPAH